MPILGIACCAPGFGFYARAPTRMPPAADSNKALANTANWSPGLVAAHFFAGLWAMLTVGVMIACWPDAIVDSALDPRTLACVHVFTLGFVTQTAIGALHAVGPLALRIPWRASWLDWTLFVCLLLVAGGVASHMALSTFGGVAWSGALLCLLLALQLPRWLLGLANSPAPACVRAGIAMALLNLLFAVILGAAVAADRSLELLPAGHQQAVFAHAHLAGGGFGATLITAVGLRLLPMFLPAAPPTGVWPWLAVGGTGLGGLLSGALGPVLPGALPLLSLPLGLGLLAFLLLVARMLRQPKPPPRDLPRPDPARCLQLTAVLALLATLGLGLWLDFGPELPARWRTVYGCLWLVGCLGSLILGMQLRLLPLVGWHAARRRLPDLQMPPPPNRSWSPAIAWLMAVAWILGLLLTAGGVAVSSTGATRIGGLLLAVATAASLWNLRRSWRLRLSVVG